MSTNIARASSPTDSHRDAKNLPCPGCSRPLPIRAPRDGENFADWECDLCHATRAGVLMSEAPPVLVAQIRLAQHHFEAFAAEPIPPTLRQLVEQFLIRRRMKQETHERRRNPRVPCDLDAVGIALDDYWNPQGEPFNAVVVDLAAHGLGMMTARRVDVTRLAIQIQCPAGPVQLLGRSAWSNQVGETFQNTGVEFAYRLGHTAIGHDSVG